MKIWEELKRRVRIDKTKGLSYLFIILKFWFRMKLFVSLYGNMIFWSQTSRLEKEHNELCMKWVI